jgi:hypothetical protein
MICHFSGVFSMRNTQLAVTTAMVVASVLIATCLARHLVAKTATLTVSWAPCRVRVLCPDCQEQLGSIASEAQALALIQQHGSSELGFLQFFNLYRTQTLIAGEAAAAVVCCVCISAWGTVLLKPAPYLDTGSRLG